jgi:hypothetical protein
MSATIPPPSATIKAFGRALRGIRAMNLRADWSGVVDREALETIKACDIRASRVFTDDEDS